MSCVYITANAQIPVIMIFIKLNLTIYLMWLTQKNRLHSCVWWDARGLLFWRGWTGFVCGCVKGADIGSLCRALSSVDHRYGSPEGWFTDAGNPTSSYFTWVTQASKYPTSITPPNTLNHESCTRLHAHCPTNQQGSAQNPLKVLLKLFAFISLPVFENKCVWNHKTESIKIKKKHRIFEF